MQKDEIYEKFSTVCLDASEVKRIREDLKLTQLYVSKVVGVTTDTISRWENNRYPTIRRENALKLAEALETPLADILQKPSEEIAPTDNAGSNRWLKVWITLLSLGLMVLVGYYLYYGRSTIPPAAVTAERLLPAFACPGSVIPVQVTLTPRTDNSGIIIREYFPKGWKIIEADPPASSLDNVNGVARWIVKAGDESDRIVYLVKVAPQAKIDSEAGFQGEIVASRQGTQFAVPVLGKSKVVVAPIHWADIDGNGRIDDGEMLEASFTIEDMAGVHIDWDDLEKLWSAGSYTWNKKQAKFLPSPPKS
jgi:transcriptional regulator with XRE-family HTH domain